MRDWEVTLSFTTPAVVGQDTAAALWGAGYHFGSLPGIRCYEWVVTLRTDTAINAAADAQTRLAGILGSAPDVFAVKSERLHPLRTPEPKAEPEPEARGCQRVTAWAIPEDWETSGSEAESEICGEPTVPGSPFCPLHQP